MNLEELVHLVESGQHGVPFDVRVKQEELTRLANDKIGAMASDISVEISPQAVSVGAKTRMAALTMDVKLVGKPLLEDGRLKFDIDRLDLNKRPAPDFMRSQLFNAVNEKLDSEELPVKVSRLELGDGWLEVAGETK